MASISTDSPKVAAPASKPAESSRPTTQPQPQTVAAPSAEDRATLSATSHDEGHAQSVAKLSVDIATGKLSDEDQSSLDSIRSKATALDKLPREERVSEIESLIPGISPEEAEKLADEAGDEYFGDLHRDAIHGRAVSAFAEENLTFKANGPVREALTRAGFSPQEQEDEGLLALLADLNPDGQMPLEIPRRSMLALGQAGEALRDSSESYIAAIKSGQPAAQALLLPAPGKFLTPTQMNQIHSMIDHADRYNQQVRFDQASSIVELVF